MPCDAFTQQIQLLFAPGDESLTAVDLPKAPMHSVTKPLDFSSEVGNLKVEPQLFERVAPARGILSND
jgi:hypothetical protein